MKKVEKALLMHDKCIDYDCEDTDDIIEKCCPDAFGLNNDCINCEDCNDCWNEEI